jgi:3-phenylpropionate/trans-cinnamate dioxygenase ferredoxin subunit
LPLFKIASSLAELQFNEQQLAEVTVNGKTICVSLHNGAVKACAYKCPHAGGRLVDGYMDALGNIVCPIHRYKFNLCNGRNVSGEGYYLKTWPVDVKEDGVYVDM